MTMTVDPEYVVLSSFKRYTKLYHRSLPGNVRDVEGR